MDKQRIKNIIKNWTDFADRQETPEKIKINPDLERVKLLAEGVINNENNHGFKYCPCRLSSGNKADDIKLICPCNFKAQKIWQEKGECWCSLFVSDNLTK